MQACLAAFWAAMTLSSPAPAKAKAKVLGMTPIEVAELAGHCVVRVCVAA